MELPKTPEEVKQKKRYELLAVVIGVLTLAAALVSIVFQARAEKKRELTCNLTSNTELTSVSSVPGLASRFTYYNKPVAHLWKISLSYLNTGNDTLIGQGTHNNLMGDGILFAFPSDTEILNFEIINNDPPVDVQIANHGGADAVADQASAPALNMFKLRFQQWRSGERFNVDVYVAAEKPKGLPLLPAAPNRDIVDGTIVVRNSLADAGQTKLPAMDRLPTAVSVTVRFLLSMISILLAVFGLFFVPKGALNLWRMASWKRKHLTEFSAYIQGLANLPQETKDRYIKSPDVTPKDVWERYTGEKPKAGVKSVLLFSNISELASIGFVAMVLGLASAVYVIANILDLILALSSRLSAA
jgi:hypothetical protein